MWVLENQWRCFSVKDELSPGMFGAFFNQCELISRCLTKQQSLPWSKSVSLSTVCVCVLVLISFLCRTTCPLYTMRPSSLPWFSWPISICLHQSYQLTPGLDSSMPGGTTPSPPCMPPSLHLSMLTYLCYTVLSLRTLTTLKLNRASQHSQSVDVHKERAPSTFLSLRFMPETSRLLTSYPLKNCNFTLSGAYEPCFWCLYLASEMPFSP